MKNSLIIKVLIFTIAVIALSACQKVVYLDLNTAETRLVIEGNITSKAGEPQRVFVSTSGDFYTGEGIGFVEDATVIMKDELGMIDTLKRYQGGIYYSYGFTPKENIEYIVEVYHDEVKYSGSEIFPEKKRIDSIWYVVNEGIFGDGLNEDGDTTYNIFVRYQDPEETLDYYRFVTSINDSITAAGFGTYFVADDELFNGQLFDMEILNSGAVKGDTITVDLQAIGYNTYTYYVGFNDLLRSGMGSTPYNPISNLNNEALGYFGAYTSDTETIIIE